MMHKGWFWPEGRADNRYRIPPNRFTDKDPYQQLGDLPWPPVGEDGSAASPVYLNPHAVDWFALKRIDRPFPDIMTALSLAPRHAELVLEAGNYPAPVTISRGVTLKVRNGAVTLGQR